MPEMKFFELEEGGRSHQAVLELHNSLSQLCQNLIKSGVRDRAAIVDSIRGHLNACDATLIQRAGLDNLSICVEETIGEGLPRAYAHYPMLFNSTLNRGDTSVSSMFMCSPVDYNGEYFTPEDAREITDKRELIGVKERLFGGGSTSEGYLPGSLIKKEGVDLPSDYSPLLFESGKENKNYFIALGRSLACVEECQKQGDEFVDKAKAFSAALKSVITKKMEESIKADHPHVNEISVSSGFAYGKQGSFDFSFFVLGDDNAIDLPENPFFDVEGAKYRCKFRPKMETEEGRHLADLYEAVPQYMTLSDYPDLLSDHGKGPQKVAELEDNKILIYELGEGDRVSPPDAVEMPATLYHWIRSDHSIEKWG